VLIDDGLATHVFVDDDLVGSVDHRRAAAVHDPPHIIAQRNKPPDMYFTPPDFGISVLGSADGFSADGTTAGFVLWMRGRGILVDPPAHSAQYLRQGGIASRKVTHVILTHCHADHDAGTFQKILLEDRVTVVTTRTIMASFMRKYALVTGVPAEYLARLFLFLPVKIAEPMRFQGGSISFFYSLHALPCIGFRAELGGKSITYSSDTYYDPEGLKKLKERGGIISEARMNSLLTSCSVQKTDLLLHEAGVPPIHTPLEVLKALPEDLLSVLKVIHVSDKRAAEAGLPKCQVGFENTLAVDVPACTHAEATNITNTLLSTDLFRSFDAKSAIDLLLVTTFRRYEKGAVICTEGTMGSHLWVVQSGTVQMQRDNMRAELRYGDYFGEEALVVGGKHKGTATAHTNVELLEISKSDIQWLMTQRPNFRDRVMRRSQLRYAASCKAIAANAALSSCSMSQMMQLQSIMREEMVTPGQVMWKRGAPVEEVILVGEGSFYFKEITKTRDEPYKQGALMVDTLSMERNRPHRLTLAASEEGFIFRVLAEDFLNFLQENPGFLIRTREKLVVE